MKDEIKEILNYLTRFNEEDKYSYSPEYLLDTEEIRLLYDYITNLQEKIYKKEAMYDSLAVDYRLAQEENERLKENNQNMQVEMARSWKKIDKAIEYIEGVYQRNDDGTDNIWIFDFGKIESILKGEDKE